MPIVVCARCGKALASDLHDHAGETMTPAHMASGTARWCAAEVADPFSEHGTVDRNPDRDAAAGSGRDRDAAEAMERRRDAAARIDAVLRERAELSELAFAAEIERRRTPPLTEREVGPPTDT